MVRIYPRYLVDNFQTTFRIQDTFNVHFRHIQNAFQILSRLFYYILQAMSRHLLSTRSKTKFPKVYLRFVVFISLRQVNRKTKIHTLPPSPTLTLETILQPVVEATEYWVYPTFEKITFQFSESVWMWHFAKPKKWQKILFSLTVNNSYFSDCGSSEEK